LCCSAEQLLQKKDGNLWWPAEMFFFCGITDEISGVGGGCAWGASALSKVLIWKKSGQNS